MKKIIFISILCFATLGVFAQVVSISPTRLYFDNEMGEIKTKTVTMINNGDKEVTFTSSLSNFIAPNNDGKIQMLPDGEIHQNAISPYLSISPSFFVLKPKEQREIEITLNIPNIPEAAGVKWGNILFTQAREQKNPIDAGSEGVLGMGILNTIKYSIYVFQTPKNVGPLSAEISQLEVKENSIQSTSEQTETTERFLIAGVKNTSNAILDCRSYVELVNLETGEKIDNKPSIFTLLPNGSKIRKVKLENNLPKGNYNILFVFDYGSKLDIQAAEIEYEIK